MKKKVLLMSFIARGTSQPSRVTKELLAGKAPHEFDTGDMCEAIKNDNHPVIDKCIQILEGSAAGESKARNWRNVLTHIVSKIDTRHRDADMYRGYASRLIRHPVWIYPGDIDVFIQTNDLEMMKLIHQQLIASRHIFYSAYMYTAVHSQAISLEMLKFVAENTDCNRALFLNIIRYIKSSDLDVVRFATENGAAWYGNYLRNALLDRRLETIKYLRETFAARCYITITTYFSDMKEREARVRDFDKEAFYRYVVEERLLEGLMLKVFLEDDGVSELYDQLCS